MTDQSTDSVDATGSTPEEKLAAVPIWLRATIADVQAAKFEAPIVGSVTADSDVLSEEFRAFLKPQEQDGELPDTPATRVASMLSAIAGMHFRPGQRNEPFGAMVTFADGRRSAVPEDFRGHVETLAYMAERAANPVLRARLSDVCWLLDRKRGNLGSRAISTYIEIVQKADASELKWRFAKDEEMEDPGLQYDARDYLRRALHIGRSIGWDKPEMIVPRELVVQLRKRANVRPPSHNIRHSPVETTGRAQKFPPRASTRVVDF